MAHRVERARIAVYLTPEELRRLEQAAATSLRSVSSEARAAIQAWLKQREESA